MQTWGWVPKSSYGISQSDTAGCYVCCVEKFEEKDKKEKTE